jgi:predicted Rossmann fold flavoprotein
MEDKKEYFDVIVVGAGPAGCMAAIKASENNKRVLLLEKNNDICKKLLLTGNKRGNITNLSTLDEFLPKYRNGNFLRNGFARFFNSDLIDFFESNGLKIKVERGKRVYPASEKAEDIANLFKVLIAEKKIHLHLRSSVTNISYRRKSFELTTSKNSFACEKLIICCGGASFPDTGSEGDGYIWAKNLGHTIIDPLPALCGIITEEWYVKKWQGTTLKNIVIQAELEGKKIGEEFGEIIFTHYGISGPAALNLSRIISENKDKGLLNIVINLKPGLDDKTLDNRLIRELETNSKKQLKNLFKNLLPLALISPFLRYAKLDEEKLASSITKEERKRILDSLQRFSFVVKDTRSFNDSMVTRGGVNTKEINPKTMESKIVPKLYFAGEVIDIDGKTGGYNLQAAFTTGYVAGVSV